MPQESQDEIEQRKARIKSVFSEYQAEVGQDHKDIHQKVNEKSGAKRVKEDKGKLTR